MTKRSLLDQIGRGIMLGGIATAFCFGALNLTEFYNHFKYEKQDNKIEASVSFDKAIDWAKKTAYCSAPIILAGLGLSEIAYRKKRKKNIK